MIVRPFVPGGAEGIRTPDPLHAMEVRYQLRYSPEWVSPEGATVSLPMHPRARPNRPQGGGDPACDATPDEVFHVWMPPSGAALDELGPVAVAQGPEHAPGEVGLQPEQPRGGRATRRTVGRDDEALPRPECLEVLREARLRPARATSATVSPWSPRRASSPRARASCTSGHRSATSAAVRPCQAPTSISRKRGSRATGMPHARPTLCAVSRARARSEETMRSGERAAIAGPTASACAQAQLGQRRVEVALPDAGRVVVGLAVPQHDDAAGARRRGSAGLTDRPARCRRRRGRSSGSPSTAARARRRSAPRRAARARRCRRSR